MESRARRSWCDHQVAKYGRRLRRYRSDSKRMPYGERNANVEDVVEIGSQGHLILRVEGDVEN